MSAGSGSGGNEKHSSGLPLARITERDAKVSVWVDFEKCRVPDSCVSRMSCRIVDALRELGYRSGDLSITVYADFNLITETKREALQQSGVILSHIDHIERDAFNYKMLEDFGTWAQIKEPPATLLIVSGDVGFWPTMNTLRNYGYNVMMACSPSHYLNYPPANTVMCWKKLLQGVLYPAQIQLCNR